MTWHLTKVIINVVVIFIVSIIIIISVIIIIIIIISVIIIIISVVIIIIIIIIIITVIINISEIEKLLCTLLAAVLYYSAGFLPKAIIGCSFFLSWGKHNIC